MDTILEILQTIRRNKFRTAMTGFAVFWGIFILVVLMGASSGLQHGITNIFQSSADNSVNIYRGWTQLPYKGLPIMREIRFSDKEYRFLCQSNIVDHISPVAEYNLTARFKNLTTNINLTGVNQDYNSIHREKLIAGRFLSTMDFADNRKVVVLNKLALNELANGDSTIVGQYIVMGDIFFRVIGVVKDEGWQSQAFIPLSIHQRIYSTDHYANQLTMTLSDNYIAATAADTVPLSVRIRRMLAPIMRFDPEDNGAIWVDVKEETIERMTNLVSILQMLILIVSICTLISGAVGVSNIMLVSVKERTKELGIRKALGAPPAQVMRSVIAEALTITLLFGALGILAGNGVVAILRIFVGEGSEIFVNPTIDAPTVVLALGILVIVGVVAGAIPALRAMNVRPVEAMNAS